MRALRASHLKSRPVLLVAGVIGLVLAYAIATRAIDTGSWWEYFGCLVFLVLGIKLIIRAFKKK
jgi:hypothetical protein